MRQVQCMPYIRDVDDVKDRRLRASARLLSAAFPENLSSPGALAVL